MVQDAQRDILQRIYEPVFSRASYGLRSRRSRQTVLKQVQEYWTGTKWFVEVDSAADVLRAMWANCASRSRLRAAARVAAAFQGLLVALQAEPLALEQHAQQPGGACGYDLGALAVTAGDVDVALAGMGPSPS